MPGLWVASVVMVLALGGRGQAQTPADSLSGALSPALAGTDSLGLESQPALGDSLPPSAAAADSLSQSAIQPVLPPPSAPPTLTLPPALPNPSPRASSLPRRTRFAAQRRGFLTTRTLWAAGCLGGSLMLYNRGSDYRNKADDFYARYQQAADPTEIESLYQRTTNQDTKGQVCWALSGALALNGLRLLFTNETEVVSAEVSRPSLQMILAPQSLQLRVWKWL